MTVENQRIVDESTIASHVCATIHQLRAWIVSSWLVRAGTALADTLSTAATTSTLASAGRTLTHWTRQSYIYRWLTKEPEPDVIVIDLRETYTVGPFIMLLDRVVPQLDHAYRSSNLKRTLDATTTTVRDAPIRAASLVVVVAVFTNTLLVALGGSLATSAVFARAAVLGLALAGTQIETPWRDLAQARAVRLLKAALEPPEPPEEHGRE